MATLLGDLVLEGGLGFSGVEAFSYRGYVQWGIKALLFQYLPQLMGDVL